jgi:hypothetical protein
LKAYRIAIAIVGTLVAVIAAAVTALYLAILVLPLLIGLGSVILLMIQRSGHIRVPLGALGASILGLIAITIFDAANRGNWNQPGSQWLLLPVLAAIVVLGATAFAIYARYVESTLVSLVGGPALVAAAGTTFWWLLQADAARADLYMYRLAAVLPCLYGLLGTMLLVDRRWLARLP